MTRQMTRQEILELAAKVKPTLDGKPAAIGGTKLNFMMVGALDGSAKFEFSDKAIIHVLTNKKGAFKS